MINLETATKLKEAGLKWEPKNGDWAYNLNGKATLVGDENEYEAESFEEIAGKPFSEAYAEACSAFAPRLDQLLSEIENRAFGWDLRAFACDDYRCDLLNSHYMFSDTSPEKAAADALLWILEQKK